MRHRGPGLGLGPSAEPPRIGDGSITLDRVEVSGLSRE
jgi:hypothetical protein